MGHNEGIVWYSGAIGKLDPAQDAAISADDGIVANLRPELDKTVSPDLHVLAYFPNERFLGKTAGNLCLVIKREVQNVF